MFFNCLLHWIVSISFLLFQTTSLLGTSIHSVAFQLFVVVGSKGSGSDSYEWYGGEDVRKCKVREVQSEDECCVIWYYDQGPGFLSL